MSRKLAAAVLSVLSVLVPTVGAEAAPAEPLEYVALGDSYSAASGVLPVDISAPQCLRSTRNYPRVIAASIGARLTDVSCGGADTGDFFAEQYPGTPPQLLAVHPNVDLVTMTIGGNDSSVFINAILLCGTAGASTLGWGSPCKDRYGASFENTIRNTTYPALVTALTEVKRRAPRAKIAILGYPWIMPASGGCFLRMPIAAGDVPYLRGIQATLNDAVRRAAAASGVTYVDMNAVSNGHDACQPIGTRWVEPVALGTNPVVVHPNALGEAKMAERAMAVLRLR